MDLHDAGRSVKFLIRDRDAKYTSAFDAVLAGAGVKTIRTPPQAPRANAVCERWVGTTCRECTDRILITGRRQLTEVLDQFVHHYNGHRPHQSLDQRQPVPRPAPDRPPVEGSIWHRTVLGGLINEYQAAA